MSDQFFVRIRGRIHGPMPIVKLKELAAKGQLSRVHEISSDGQSWRAAASEPELFTRSGSPPSAASRIGVPTGTTNFPATSNIDATEEGPMVARSNLSDITLTRRQSATDDHALSPHSSQSATGQSAINSIADASLWYYATDGQQQGPVSRSHLLDMIMRGQLAMQDMVWRDGMGQWNELSRVPELVNAIESSTSPRHSVASSGGAEDAGSVVRRLMQCKGWIRVSIVSAFILAIFMAIGGIGQIVLGFASSQTTVLLAGAIPMTYSGLLIWLGAILIRANGQIQLAESNPTIGEVASAIASMRQAWMALALLLLWTLFLIVMAMVIVGVILAIGGDSLGGISSRLGN